MKYSPGFDVPDHVPHQLVWDHEPNAFAAQFDDPFVGMSELHNGPDMVFVRNAYTSSGAWMPTRYAIINDVFMDSAHFSSVGNINIAPLLDVDWRLNPVDFDPPQHMLYRQILQPYFQPSAINRYEAQLREIARDLVDGFVSRKQCEFIEEFANLFPSNFFLDLLGMPRTMLPQFLEWGHEHSRAPTFERRATASKEILKYIESYIAARRKDERDDIVSAVLRAKIGDRLLDHGEVIGMIMLIYFGGLDTVVSSLGWYFRYLARNPSLQKRLRDNPEDIPAAVDELLRAYGVVTTKRTVTRDIEFYGVQMKKGDIVMTPGYLASRDDRQYANPHVVDPDRKARHISLATGVHNCLGAHLARREIKIVLEELLPRLDNIRIAENGVEEFQTAGVWAMTRLDLAWD